jgi:hypothetical protein
MSRGFLIFAFNNEVIDYLGHALWIANRIERFMGLPTTIVTNETRETQHNLVLTEALPGRIRNFGTHEKEVHAEWKNVNRFQAYKLSPYDETIVIDSDYIVNTDQLATLFDSPQDFLCYRDVHDLTDTRSWDSHDTFGQFKFPHYWATVIFFRKTEFAQDIFDLMRMVKENYNHYAQLYKFRIDGFRNDFAISIAMSIAYGHRLDAIPTIPWRMPMAAVVHDVKQLADTEFEIHYKKKDKPMRVKVKDQDIHCLNKFALEEIVSGS